MPADQSPEAGTRSDSELLELIKTHTTDRRSVMKALGVGTALSLGAGTATADRDPPGPSRIDSYYGYAVPGDKQPPGRFRPDDEVPPLKRLPGNLQPDHEVGLHIHEHSLIDGDKTTMPFHFAPTGLHVDEGDIIGFSFDSPEHTITAYHEGHGRQQRVPDDKPPFSSPIIDTGGFWLYEFDSPGTYDLFCSPHELFGMVMRVVVGDPDDSGYDGTFGPAGQPPKPRPPAFRGELTTLGITSFPFPTAAEVLGTDALTVSSIVSNGSVSYSDVEADL